MVSSIAYTQRFCVKNKDTQAEKLKIPLKLKRSKCNNGKTNLNCDCSDLVIKNAWTTLLRHISNLESALSRLQNQFKTNLTSKLTFNQF